MRQGKLGQIRDHVCFTAVIVPWDHWAIGDRAYTPWLGHRDPPSPGRCRTRPSEIDLRSASVSICQHLWRQLVLCLSCCLVLHNLCLLNVVLLNFVLRDFKFVEYHRPDRRVTSQGAKVKTNNLNS